MTSKSEMKRIAIMKGETATKYTLEDCLFIVGKTLKFADEYNLDLVKGNMKYLQRVLKEIKKVMPSANR